MSAISAGEGSSSNQRRLWAAEIFTFVDIETGQIIDRTVNGGHGLDPARLFTCEFVFEDVEVPGLPGLRDVRFIVQGLPTPQGPPDD